MSALAAGRSGNDTVTKLETQLVNARHGIMLVNPRDYFVGQAIIAYGEYSEPEQQALAALVSQSQGDVVEIGANIGAHSVPLARALSDRGGRLIAFEPQPVVFQMLCANIALNGLANVLAWPFACGAEAGVVAFAPPDYGAVGNFGAVEMTASAGGAAQTVPRVRLDDWAGESRIGLIKIDVEGQELAALTGATATLARHRPLLYLENDRFEQSPALITWLNAAGYRLWWHLPPLFSAANFFGQSENRYPNLVSVNMIGVPREIDADMGDLRPIEDAGWHPLKR